MIIRSRRHDLIYDHDTGKKHNYYDIISNLWCAKCHKMS
jgi:hypothetical protein